MQDVHNSEYQSQDVEVELEAVHERLPHSDAAQQDAQREERCQAREEGERGGGHLSVEDELHLSSREGVANRTARIIHLREQLLIQVVQLSRTHAQRV